MEEEIAEARELVGPDAELMLDFWMGLDVETAVRTAERLRPYNLKWLEDAFLPDTLDEYEHFRERVPWQTLATGEHWYGVYPFFHAAKEGLVDILQPDIIWCGGLTPLIKICHIAESAGLSVIPHGSGGTAYGQHACYGLAAVPMIECSGPVMTEPGVPLHEKDSVARNRRAVRREAETQRRAGIRTKPEARVVPAVFQLGSNHFDLCTASSDCMIPRMWPTQ